MSNAKRISVRVEICKADYDDPMAALEDAFFEAADAIVPEPDEGGDGMWEVLTESFWTVRIDDNGENLAATITATEKKD